MATKYTLKLINNNNNKAFITKNDWMEKYYFKQYENILEIGNLT